MTSMIASEAAPWTVDLSKHPLVPARVKDTATRIYKRLANGDYSYGTRLPAERDLAAGLGESRATIRQSLEFLAVYGLVSRQPGGGTFAAYQKRSAVEVPAIDTGARLANIDQLAETASPFAMNIAVSILAPEMIRLSTIYMSVRDLADLEQQIQVIEAIVTDADKFAELEEDFMMTIARGTHNQLVVAMYSILHEVRRRPQWVASRRRALTPAKIKNTQLLLRSLYDAIEKRKIETAVETIKLHVSNTHEDMIYES